MSDRRSIVSPDDQSVTFVELFFDLVFVFSVTQVVGVLYHDLDWLGVAQSVLIFWLVWWAWTQFTWTLNSADTTHPSVQLGTLVATGVTFFMAVSIPRIFSGEAIWFALPYVLVRILGLGLYIRVSLASGPEQRKAVRTFSMLSVGGLVAVLAGALAGGTTTYWFWGMAILLDLIAAMVSGEIGDWNLHPDHFAERHGLFIIIALGETLIVAAGGLTEAELTLGLKVVGALAVAATCVLWWSYFSSAKPRLDRSLEEAAGVDRTSIARDAYSLLHFPMVLGIIAFATGVEAAVHDPSHGMAMGPRLALGAGMLLFTGSMALALWRGTGRLPAARLLIGLATALAIVLWPQAPPAALLALVVLGATAICWTERRDDTVSAL